VAASKVETAVWDYICGVLKDPTQVTAKLQKLRDMASAEYRGLEDEISHLCSQLESNGAAQERLAELYVAGKIKREILDRQAQELEDQATELEGTLSMLRVQLQQAQQDQLPIQSVQDACQLLREGLDEYPFERKRWLLRMLVQDLYADKEGWTLTMRLPGMEQATGDYATLRNRSGRRSP
jgi:hypothetical protein